jgi:Na+-driven multidrug efflux pump
VSTTIFFWISIATIVSPMFTLINTAFAGRLTTEELASYGLAAAVISMFGTAFCIAFSVGQMTLTSQAFGAGNIRECIVLRNKSLYLVTLIYGVLFSFFCSSEKVFRAFGVQE